MAPGKLARLAGPQAWVQVACPRLSIDWGEGFALPTLTPFEALIALGEVRSHPSFACARGVVGCLAVAASAEVSTLRGLCSACAAAL